MFDKQFWLLSVILSATFGHFVGHFWSEMGNCWSIMCNDPNEEFLTSDQEKLLSGLISSF